MNVLEKQQTPSQVERPSKEASEQPEVEASHARANAHHQLTASADRVDRDTSQKENGALDPMVAMWIRGPYTTMIDKWSDLEVWMQPFLKPFHPVATMTEAELRDEIKAFDDDRWRIEPLDGTDGNERRNRRISGANERLFDERTKGRFRFEHISPELEIAEATEHTCRNHIADIDQARAYVHWLRGLFPDQRAVFDEPLVNMSRHRVKIRRWKREATNRAAKLRRFRALGHQLLGG